MRLGRFHIGFEPKTETKATDTLTINQLVERLESVYSTTAGQVVTPDLALEAPTVHAVVTAVSRRIAISPVEVYAESKTPRGRTQRIPADRNHPVVRLMRRPNQWQTRANYWLDATSQLMRYGGQTSFKSRASTGPTVNLIPLNIGNVEVKQNGRNTPAPFTLRFEHANSEGGIDPYSDEDIMYSRSGSRDFVKPDSPVNAIRNTIALELAAEEFAGAFFGNGALPLLVFKFLEGYQGFQTDEDQQRFLAEFKAAFTSGKQMGAFMLPKGMDVTQVAVEQDKAQFIETRRYIRTTIAGAFGCPPHLVGDLERATYDHVEQQDIDFTTNCVMPVAEIFEAAMERDLLSDADRRNNVKVRFDLDAVARADFKSRSEALKLQREWGIISADEWREAVNRNPLGPERGGDVHYVPLNYQIMGENEGPANANREPDPATAEANGATIESD